MDMTIGKLAEACGVGVETIRFYQRKGLMQTPARAGTPGHGGSVRRYDEADARQLRFIRSAQAAGFSLEKIKDLLELDARTDRERARQLAVERIAMLDATIADLQTMRATLAHLHESCLNEDGGLCPIITAFGAHDHGNVHVVTSR